MTLTDKENEEIRQYLLGKLLQADEQRVEERLMIEDDFLESLLLGEDELIDDFVGNELSGDDRQRFEQHFLSTLERQKKLKFALALNRYTSNAQEKKSAPAKAEPSASPTRLKWSERLRAFWISQPLALRAITAVALIAIIVSALWLARPHARPPQTFATLTLNISSSDRSTGAQAGTVKLPLDADALRITLLLPGETSSTTSYRVELVTDSGETKPLAIEGQDAHSVSTVIPATQLERGRYALRLFQIAADGSAQRINGSYFFTIE